MQWRTVLCIVVQLSIVQLHVSSLVLDQYIAVMKRTVLIKIFTLFIGTSLVVVLPLLPPPSCPPSVSVGPPGREVLVTQVGSRALMATLLFQRYVTEYMGKPDMKVKTLFFIEVSMKSWFNRGLTEENTQLCIISPIWVFQIPNWWYSIQLGICDLFSDSALPDSYIPNPQLDILSPVCDLKSPRDAGEGSAVDRPI